MESSRATLPYDNRSASGTSYESYLLIAQHVREQIRARELDPYTSRDEVVSIIEASVQTMIAGCCAHPYRYFMMLQMLSAI